VRFGFLRIGGGDGEDADAVSIWGESFFSFFFSVDGIGVCSFFFFSLVDRPMVLPSPPLTAVFFFLPPREDVFLYFDRFGRGPFPASTDLMDSFLAGWPPFSVG